MPNVFLISDTHFGHANILTFTDHQNKIIRPFTTLREMHETIINNWNNVVRPEDKVYHLGDVSLGKRGLEIMGQLNGRKVLIKGNHDNLKLKEYAVYFKDVRSVHLLDKRLALTHIPIHPVSLIKGYINVHGHMHNRKIQDPSWYNVSVEQIDYTPVELSDLHSRINRVIDEVLREKMRETSVEM